MKTLDPERLAALVRAHAEEELRENRVGGKEIVVWQGGQSVFHAAFGSVAPGGAPFPKGLLYRAASMTKPVTAAAVLQLWARGLIDLDAPAYTYLPELREMQVASFSEAGVDSLRPAKNVILVKDLLMHTSGVGSGPLFEIYAMHDCRLPFRAAVKKILTEPLAFEPRTEQSYSATNAFDLAAAIVEIASGEAYHEYLQKHIFEPLGMADTTFSPSPAQWARMAPMHSRTPEGESKTAYMPKGNVFECFTPARTAAGAGLATTAADYIRFADMLAAGGVSAEGVRVLSEAAVRRMRTPDLPAGVEMGCEKWGLGVRVVTGEDYPHGLGVGCFGWSGAYGTHFWADPENRIAAVLMKNSRYDGGAGNRSACELEEDVSNSLT